jgi:DNA/RNA-binding domain of Phe-tRNA-synthetase-like protein
MTECMSSEAWRSTYPGAHVGILAMRGVANPDHHAGLDKRKEELEKSIRSRYSGYDRADLKDLPALKAYGDYYRAFKKTYHLQLQLESILLKDRSIPQVAALVEAMFMAEMDNLLLTAGHDLEALEMPMVVGVSEGTESYVGIGGNEQRLKQGDMMISDARGILSSVIYGPAKRGRITRLTRQAIFTVYAPPGIGEEAVRKHLGDIQANVLVVAPEAVVLSLEVLGE